MTIFLVRHVTKDERKYYETLLQYSQEHLMVITGATVLHLHPLSQQILFLCLSPALSLPPSRHADKGASCHSVCVLQQRDVHHYAGREELRFPSKLHSCRL